MGTCCFCLSSTQEKTDPNIDSAKASSESNHRHKAKTVDRSHLKIFLKNFAKYSKKNYSIKTSINLAKYRQSSATSSFTSIMYSNDGRNNNIKLPENADDAYSYDYEENLEYDHFDTPNLQLAGINSNLSKLKNVDSGNYSGLTKQGAYFNQINQVNVDGFEWDLV